MLNILCSQNKDDNKNTDAIPTEHESGPKAGEDALTWEQALTGQQLSTALDQGETTHQQKAAATELGSANKGSTSEKKIAANRRNALLSTGPRNTEQTRYNATKHGLLASGLTKLDDSEEFLDNVEAMTDIYQPADPIEKFFVKSAALDMVRAGRIDRIEADAFNSLSNISAGDSGRGPAPMVDFTMFKEYLGPVLDRTQRYHTAISNRMLRYQRVLNAKHEDESAPADSASDTANTGGVVKKVN